MNRTIVFAMLLASGWFTAQANQDQAQQPPKEKPGHVSVQGCVSRSSGDFTLTQSDPGNTYVIRPSGKIKLDPYLGQQVEVTGQKTPTPSNSSNYNRRPASAVTIVVESIKTIAAQCGT
jgi:hypothetical protein